MALSEATPRSERHNRNLDMVGYQREDGMWDIEGHRYMDVSSGPVVSNVGHGDPDVANAMAAQARKMDYAFARLARNRPNLEYSERLAQLAGPGFERVSLTSGGSEAMENAIKLLRQYAMAKGQASKTKIITCQPSYHGATIATLAMNGEVMMEPFLAGFAEPSAKVPAPLSYRPPANHDTASYAHYCADCLEAKILELGVETVLAFVIEPVGGLSTGGSANRSSAGGLEAYDITIERSPPPAMNSP